MLLLMLLLMLLQNAINGWIRMDRQDAINETDGGRGRGG